MGAVANHTEQQQHSQLETTPEAVDALFEILPIKLSDEKVNQELQTSEISVDRPSYHHLQVPCGQAARYDDIDDITSLASSGLSLDFKVVKKLILAGASLSILNSYERTPVDKLSLRGKWM